MAKQKRVRVTFHAPPAFEAGANIWVLDGTADAKPTVTLMRDYPDLKPAVGWHLDIMGTTYEVTAVNGLVLSIVTL